MELTFETTLLCVMFAGMFSIDFHLSIGQAKQYTALGAVAANLYTYIS